MRVAAGCANGEVTHPESPSASLCRPLRQHTKSRPENAQQKSAHLEVLVKLLAIVLLRRLGGGTTWRNRRTY